MIMLVNALYVIMSHEVNSNKVRIVILKKVASLVP
jgi:hypothetical protein